MEVFNKESDFEEALIEVLTHKGWENKIIKYPTEEDLLKNWAEILFNNNRGIDRLDKYPLTDGEMQQILEQINTLRTPIKLNGFINGRTISIKRDNPEDKVHYGKEISLKIYDRREIAAGQSRYQIAQQPRFKTNVNLGGEKRGDLLLLINGMPVIHIELKKSGIPVKQACNQIERYIKAGVFTGLFSLVQIFVAMEPNETYYFANPGPLRKDERLNKNFFFHWADFNNEPINEWNKVASTLLSIPMAHQLIGFYTVADDSDGSLKVMRSYQYYAANAISDKVAKTKWEEGNQLGGYIWHTTGSGKTMTSFKSAQLIASSKDADKVVFLMDRIELGTQSLKEYRGFADENERVQETDSTRELVAKLKSDNPADTLIVTSIQKMSNIQEEGGFKSSDINIINRKRIVIIVDEAHRSTFGEMLVNIKETFPRALFFGFTGTPIQDENRKKYNTTATIFGNELHRYSIADGIRDKNVLGFDPRMVLTFKDREVRKTVALHQAKAENLDDALNHLDKKRIYETFMDPGQTGMAGYTDKDGNYIKGIEDYLPRSQYETVEHTEAVVRDIVDNWDTLSVNSEFHAIFATSSIHEAINYYRLLKKAAPGLKISALFDPGIDNDDFATTKEDALSEIVRDYNKMFGRSFDIPSFPKMKKDIAARLAHKKPYERIGNESEKDKQLNLLIVVDQMLTGFDSKWINTLYLDKSLKYEEIIQAFSRTNRIYGEGKPYGIIKYYRKPHTMEVNIEKAVKLYSGDRPLGLFVRHLPDNLKMMNNIYDEITYIFETAGIHNFEKLPSDFTERNKFAKEFNNFNMYLQSARLQGFTWDKKVYKDEKTREDITVIIDQMTYNILVARYKELSRPDEPGTYAEDIPYDIEGYITEINTSLIDDDYMNSRFTKYLKTLNGTGTNSEEFEKAEEDLHRTFATLTQEEQKYANIFLHDIQSGDVIVTQGKTFKDYIMGYIQAAHNDQIHKVAVVLGLDEDKLRKIMSLHLTLSNLNEYGRYDEVKNTVDKKKAKEYFEKIEGTEIIPHKVTTKIDELLSKFITSGGFDIDMPEDAK